MPFPQAVARKRLWSRLPPAPTNLRLAMEDYSPAPASGISAIVVLGAFPFPSAFRLHIIAVVPRDFVAIEAAVADRVIYAPSNQDRSVSVASVIGLTSWVTVASMASFR